MQIFADEDGPLAGSMEKMLAPIGDRNGVTVFLERKVLHGFRQELHGLDDVLQHAESGAPIVMFAWQSPVMLADDPRFLAGLRKRWETISASATQTIGKRLMEIIRTGREANLSAKELAEE